MASPFNIFRKHQKVLIAVAGLMAMIAFVFLPMILQSMDHRAVDNPVVVSTKLYGNLKESDLYQMRQRRQRLANFLEAALKSTGEDPMIVMAKWRQLRQMIGETTERATVDRWLMTHHAERMSMTVGDDVISEFLHAWTDNRLSGERFAQLYKQSSTSEEEVFNTLHDELLAKEARDMFLTSIVATTPGQRWDYYQRLNRRVTVETAPVAVAGFVNQIPEPSEAELKEFFDQYKGNYANPASAEPGFRVPRRAAFQYLKADYATFTDPQAVTDKEIEAYYQEHRDRDYQNVELPGLDALSLPGPAAPSTPGASVEGPVAPADAPKKPEAEPKAEEPKTPEAAEPKVEEPKKPAATGPEPPAAEKPAPAEQKEEPKKDVAPQEPAGDAKGEEAPKKTSSLGPTAPVRLVSMQQKDASQEDAAKKDEPKADEAKKDEAKKDEPQTGPAEPKQADAAAEKKPAAEPAKEGEKPATDEKPKLELPALPPSLPGLETKPPSAPDAGKKADEGTPPATPAPQPAQTAEPKPKYKPLAEVKDDIRRILARKKSDERIMAVFAPIQSKMNKFHSELILWNTKEEDQRGAKPELDLAALARAGNLSFHDTGLVSELEASELDVGKSRVEGQNEFARVAFEGQPVHRPDVSQDSDQNYYLFWKTAETEEKVPDFDDAGVRDEVLAAWKRVQARELAVKKANQLADQARRSGQSLQAALGNEPGVVVSKDGPFSWLTGGTVPTTMYRDPLRISRVDHVELAGNDFMRTVYGLKAGEIGVAMNQPKTVAYVVQLVETTPSESVLWQMFKADDYSKYASVAEGDQSAMHRAWLDGLRVAAGLKWQREADQRQAR